MEYGVHPLNGYSLEGMSGYFDAYVQNIEAMQTTQAMQNLQNMHNLQTMQNLQTMHNLQAMQYTQATQNTQATQLPNWTTTLVELQSQKSYLEDLLSKTAITLNTLRGRHARNERALMDNPRPRLKKRKIQQNQWRTDKTIKTCEKEEMVLLGCLRVCETNMNTLGSILYPTEASSFAADYRWSTSWASRNDTTSSVTDIDWNGWADGEPISPFQRETRRPRSITSLAPEETLEGICPSYKNVIGGKPPPLPPRLQPRLDSAAVPPPPPNTARSTQYHPALSLTADSFKPNSSASDDEGEACRREMDKLSISSLLASKQMKQLRAAQKKRFADAALSHLYTRLSEHQGNGCPRQELRRGTSYPEERRKAKLECLKADCLKATGFLRRRTSI